MIPQYVPDLLFEYRPEYLPALLPEALVVPAVLVELDGIYELQDFRPVPVLPLNLVELCYDIQDLGVLVDG